MAEKSSETQQSQTGSGAQPDPEPIVAEREAQQPAGETQQSAGEGQPWGEWASTAAPASDSERDASHRLRAGLITGGALAGGGALALIIRRGRAGAQQAATKRRLLLPWRLRRAEQRRTPSKMELLRSRVWRR